MKPLTSHVTICGLGTQGRFMGPPPPHHFFLFVCLLSFLIYVLYALIMHKFGVAVHVQYSTKSSTSTRGASKMDRLLFTLTIVVLMAAHGEYCTTLEFEL